MPPLPQYMAGARPPSAAWMGMDVLEYRPDAMSARLRFTPKPEMKNFGGVVQGGFLAAMMDDAMGSLLFHALGGTLTPATIDLSTHFFQPVPLERIEVEAEVTKAGKAVAFAQAMLYRADGELSARAACSVKLRPFTGLQFES